MNSMFETILNLLFFLTGIIFSAVLLLKSREKKSYIILGLLGFSISLSEGFHVFPKVLAEYGVSVFNIYEYFGAGQTITAIVMSLLFVFYYWIYKVKYQHKSSTFLDISIYSLAIFRIIFSFVDVTYYISNCNNISLTLIRHTPYIIMSGLLIITSYSWSKRKDDLYLKYICIALTFMAYCVFNETTNEVKNSFDLVPVILIVATISTLIYFSWSGSRFNKIIKKLE